MRINKLIIACTLFVFNFCYALSDENKYDACFTTAQSYYQVPVELLKAIAFVESHYNPNAYNENNNGTYDIGLMQINSTWLPKLAELGISEKMLYDPCQSIYIGAWILANNVKTYGLNWTAVQRYNGTDIDLKYATKIYDRIQETYPELLRPSEAKLIPIKSANNLQQESLNSIKESSGKIVAENKVKAQSTMVDNESKSVTDVDTILRQSGVKITLDNRQNKLVKSDKVSTSLSAKNTVESAHKLAIESSINIDKKDDANTNPNLAQFVINIDENCRIFGYWFCSFNYEKYTAILASENAQKISTISPHLLTKTIRKISRKNHKNTTSTMIVI